MKSLLLYVAFVMCLVNWECGILTISMVKSFGAMEHKYKFLVFFTI